ncbi:MAG: type IV pilus modification protein PilV [Gammaproteobacteria bacterium]
MKNNKHTGFTLMEVLVALAVLSIGLLGMAGMQLFSLKSSHDAYKRTQATLFAYDLIEKMRANRDEALSGGYDSALNAIPATVPNCQISNCSTTQVANYELAEWKCGLGSYTGNVSCAAPLNATPILPNGDGSVDRNGNVFTITITWDERNNAVPENIMVMAEL